MLFLSRINDQVNLETAGLCKQFLTYITCVLFRSCMNDQMTPQTAGLFHINVVSLQNE